MDGAREAGCGQVAGRGVVVYETVGKGQGSRGGGEGLGEARLSLDKDPSRMLDHFYPARRQWSTVALVSTLFNRVMLHASIWDAQFLSIAGSGDTKTVLHRKMASNSRDNIKVRYSRSTVCSNNRE